MPPKKGRTSSSTTATATATAKTSPSASPLTRRFTRSTTHPTSASASGKKVAEPSPAPTASSPSSSSTSTPEVDPASAASSETDREGGMLHARENALRGRTIEELGDVEEKGLLMVRSESTGSDGGAGAGAKSPRRRKGHSKTSSFEVNKFELSGEGSEGEAGGGLTSKRDKEAFALLVLLYLLQGIPLGLTFGTLPFLLKPHLSYSQLAIFALSTWPYSLKLLWSPIVDAWFVKKWGRRKSWIVPVQAVVAVGLWIIGGRVGGWLEAEIIDIHLITLVFGSLILAAATQDIAVDGWALTLLSQPNLSYASTAQTIGIGIGNALSFTVFLAFNSVDFSNKYFRSTPLDHGLVSLGGFMRFWAVVFLLVTVWIAIFTHEDPPSEDDPDMDVKKVYEIMWSIVRLKNIQSFLLVHLVCKIGFMVNDSVTSLKLLEKGLSKEDLAVAVLLDFPLQMAVGWLAAKWSRPSSPSSSAHPLTSANSSASAGTSVLRPWLFAFWARLAMAATATLVVACFPVGPIGNGYFALVIATTLLSSLTSTVQFVGICAFHTQIADPLIGGTYMTLLNTVSNLGGTWPKPLILRSVDTLTIANCYPPKALGTAQSIIECVSEQGKHACLANGGECRVERDGYYLMSIACVLLGAGLLVGYILPTVKRLSGLPMSAWRVKIPR